MKEINTSVLLVAIVLLLAVPLSLYQGWCLTMLWHWYAPAQYGDLSMKTAIGISLGVGLLNMKSRGKNDAGFGDMISVALVGPSIVLLAGWTLLFFVS